MKSLKKNWFSRSAEERIDAESVYVFCAMLFPPIAMPVALLVVIGLFGIMAPVFLTASNFTAIIYQMSITGIMAVGMTFVIMTGGIDLSVGAGFG